MPRPPPPRESVKELHLEQESVPGNPVAGRRHPGWMSHFLLYLKINNQKLGRHS